MFSGAIVLHPVPADLRYEGEIFPPESAKMQTPNWNDLRVILAISRGGTLAAAGRLLHVDDTTVARRLAALQEAIGARLCQRFADGTLRLTASGERAVLHA